ncbi:MAG: hypothetical protein N3B13_01665 [Deltaproteobacteria bacterium]|nr:hypothetical protein [Deltaproteobacteria bacterium]
MKKLVSPSEYLRKIFKVEKPKREDRLCEYFDDSESIKDMKDINVINILSLPSVYYPGSGTDEDPFILFSENSTIPLVIYIDYSLEIESVKEFINSRWGWQVVFSKNVTPQDLGVKGWKDLWHEKCTLSDYRKGYSHLWYLRNRNNRFIYFLFIFSDAIQTFDRLLVAGLNPFTVVLQDHGLGFNWSYFGGDSLLYRYALNRKKLPKLIYVASNTKPWPNYYQVSEYGGLGGMGLHSRALYTY